MNGPHDMGGFDRFGPIVPEENEPVFHSEWERRAFALNFAMAATGTWNIDAGRHGKERLDPLLYWSSSYYEYRHYALTNKLIEMGLIETGEAASGKMHAKPKPVRQVAAAAMIPGILASGGPAARPSNRPQGFRIGDPVRARNITPEGHTRLPRYARGRTGEIVAVHGTHVFPDSSAHGRGDDPQWLYTVRFSARELWGKDTADHIHLDLWEPYLEPA